LPEVNTNVVLGLSLIIVIVSGGTALYLNLTTPMEEVESVSFVTNDGVEIVGTYFPSTGDEALILIHMVGRDRNDWNKLAEELNRAKYAVLSIDLRGHGESIYRDGKTIDWSTFTEDDYNEMVLDIQAADDFLVTKGFNGRISLIGGSIGANLALNYASDHRNIKTVILLSPGLNYKGIETEDALINFGDRPILFITSNNDPGSAESSLLLYSMSIGPKEIKVYNEAGHGTEILSQHDISIIILKWLETHTG